jgi:hypothetical protein
MTKKKKIQNNSEIQCVNQCKKDKKVTIHLKIIKIMTHLLKVNQNKRIYLTETEKLSYQGVQSKKIDGNPLVTFKINSLLKVDCRSIF